MNGLVPYLKYLGCGFRLWAWLEECWPTPVPYISSSLREWATTEVWPKPRNVASSMAFVLNGEHQGRNSGWGGVEEGVYQGYGKRGRQEENGIFSAGRKAGKKQRWPKQA